MLNSEFGFLERYKSCKLCPRDCNVNRIIGKKAFCAETAELKIASACLHFGEEPPITGLGGSGTIFISGCNLHCVFCQNYQIALEGMGKVVDSNEFSKICLALQDKGAENINIVTGSHAIPAIAHGLRKAKKDGLSIPVCWNSSAFECVGALKLLEGLVDIWLPDLKTLNEQVSAKLFFTKDYGKTACEAILKMIEMSPLKFTTITKNDAECEKMLSGVIIRHLVLPEYVQDSYDVLDWLKFYVDNKAFVSLMSQYTPVPSDLKKIGPQSYLSQKDFTNLEQELEDYDFEHLFYQELIEDDSWLPDFNRVQPFSNELATPVWHWKDGFVH